MIKLNDSLFIWYLIVCFPQRNKLERHYPLERIFDFDVTHFVSQRIYIGTFPNFDKCNSVVSTPNTIIVFTLLSLPYLYYIKGYIAMVASIGD